MKLSNIGKTTGKLLLLGVLAGYATGCTTGNIYRQESTINGGHGMSIPSDSVIAALAKKEKEQTSTLEEAVDREVQEIDLGIFSTKIPKEDLEKRELLKEATFNRPVSYKVGGKTFFINPEDRLSDGLQKKVEAYNALPGVFDGDAKYVNIPGMDIKMLNVDESQNYKIKSKVNIESTGNVNSKTVITPSEKPSFQLYINNNKKLTNDVLSSLGFVGGVNAFNPAGVGYAAAGSVIFIGYNTIFGNNDEATEKNKGSFQANIHATLSNELNSRDAESRLANNLLSEYNRTISIEDNVLLSLPNQGTNYEINKETGAITITQKYVNPNGVRDLITSAVYKLGIPATLGHLAKNSTKFQRYETNSQSATSTNSIGGGQGPIQPGIGN